MFDFNWLSSKCPHSWAVGQQRPGLTDRQLVRCCSASIWRLPHCRRGGEPCVSSVDDLLLWLFGALQTLLRRCRSLA